LRISSAGVRAFRDSVLIASIKMVIGLRSS
jgi:hypothetical protein